MMLLIMSLFLAACGADDAETSSSETNNDSSTNTDSNTTDNSSSSTPQVLVFGRGADSVSLDPGTVTDGESFKVTQNLFY